MRGLWTFINGVAVGILAMEEEDSPRFVECPEGELEGLKEETEEEMDDDEREIVRAS